MRRVAKLNGAKFIEFSEHRGRKRRCPAKKGTETEKKAREKKGREAEKHREDREREERRRIPVEIEGYITRMPAEIGF